MTVIASDVSNVKLWSPRYCHGPYIVYIDTEFDEVSLVRRPGGGRCLSDILANISA